MRNSKSIVESCNANVIATRPAATMYTKPLDFTKQVLSAKAAGKGATGLSQH